MTRDEATRKFYEAMLGTVPAGSQVNSYAWFGGIVVALERLGLLKLETPADKDRIAAAERLRNMFVEVFSPSSGPPIHSKLTGDGAFEILDILTKSGFKITREPT